MRWSEGRLRRKHAEAFTVRSYVTVAVKTLSTEGGDREQITEGSTVILTAKRGQVRVSCFTSSVNRQMIMCLFLCLCEPSLHESQLIVRYGS